MMEIEIDGQICSTIVTRDEGDVWHAIVERKEKSSGDVLFRANVEVHSITALIEKDRIRRKRLKESRAKSAHRTRCALNPAYY